MRETSFWIDEGLIGSICRHCKNWVFYDWYICDKAPSDKIDPHGFGLLDLPITECRNFDRKEDKQ